MDALLFVCLGNICRSPLAEGIAKKLAAERNIQLRIDSCGTGAWHIGERPCAHSIKVAANHGIDISMLRARQFEPEDSRRFQTIVALDQKNLQDLLQLGAGNVLKLGDYGFDGADVPDPYFFQGFEGFEKVFTMIETSVTNIFDTHGWNSLK